MSTIKTIFTKDAPTPAGHYSQAVVHQGTVYVAGQLAIDKHGNKMVDTTVEEETEIVLRNIASILSEAGSSLGQVLQMTIYITDLNDWGKVNQVYGRMMGGHKPARAVVPVPHLHYGLKLEVQAIAAIG